MVEKFATTRLTVHEVLANVADTDRNTLLSRVVEILSPAVVQHLPPAFQNVNSMEAAELWFVEIIAESRLFVVNERLSGAVIGLLFVHVNDQRQAHIGYLLGEDYWGKGLASELLTGFLEFAVEEADWCRLTGGVDKDNKASAQLLQKLGFVETTDAAGTVSFYQYDLTKADRP